jgi:hypothetical protein
MRHLIAPLLIALGATLVLSSPASAKVLSFSGAERPLAKDWANYSCQNASRVRRVGSPVAQGRRAYRLEVKDGDFSWGERCEIGMGNPGRSGFPLFHNGDERWISFQVYLTDDYPVDTPLWNLFFQIHQQGDGGCPPISLGVEDGVWKMFNSARNTYVLATREMWSAPARRNRWARFTLHIKNSPDPRVGFVELLGDLDGQGQKVLLERTYTHTMTKGPSSGAPMVNHARVGIYRNPRIQGTTHILFDGFTIATDRAAGERRAFGRGPGIGLSAGPSHPTVWLRAPGPAPWSAGRARTVLLQGGVRPARRFALRPVTIQARLDGRWWRLARGRVGRDGRFSVSVNLPPTVTRRPIQLRALVRGAGHSGPVDAGL